ncbi:MAG: hypothetical protein RLZZ70_183 [Candidatus Parcubacteria bacterium]|jgi:hypothetical protein
MNLEGTKHEKAVLVVITYIIGFTSGFIAFGVGNSFADKQHSMDAYVPVTQLPPADEYTPPTSNPPAMDDEPMIDAATTTTTDIVSYVDGKLYAQVGEEQFVLSISNSVMTGDNVEGFSTQGIHEELPAYAASADNAFIYFCEQQSSDESCTHFVFDTKANVIQFVNVDGEKLVTPNDVAKSAAWSPAGLQIGEYTSATADTPWLMTNTAQTID